MKLSIGTANFWKKLLFFLILSLLTESLFYYYLGWQFALFSLSLFFVFLIWFLNKIKNKIIDQISFDSTYYSVNLEQLPLVDRNFLQTQTQELEALGFQQVKDYNLGDDQSFARVFYHPNHHCFAETCQVFTKERLLFTQNTIFMTLLEDEWILGSINRPPSIHDSLTYLWHYPQYVRLYHNNSSLSSILAHHLQVQQDMSQNLGKQIQIDLTWEDYIKLDQTLNQYRYQVLTKKFLLWAMLEVTLFELAPKAQWWGKYKPYLQT